MSKKIWKFILIVLIALLLETTVFHISYWAMRLSDVPVNRVYHLSDCETVGWTQQEDGLVSNGMQQLVIRNVDIPVRLIHVESDVAPKPTYELLFYTTEQNEEFSDQKSILLQTDGNLKANVLMHDLRLDLGNEAGLTLGELTITVNPCSFRLSLARVIAVILIVFTGKFLFSLQKSPDFYYDRDGSGSSKEDAHS